MNMSEADYQQLTLGITRKPKDPFKISEHDLMNWTISHLMLKGHFAQRINSGRTFVRDTKGKVIRSIMLAHKGTPDVCGHTKDGRALYIECKVHPNVLSPAQAQFLEEAREAGCIAEVVYSTDDVENIKGL